MPELRAAVADIAGAQGILLVGYAGTDRCGARGPDELPLPAAFAAQAPPARGP